MHRKTAVQKLLLHCGAIKYLGTKRVAHLFFFFCIVAKGSDNRLVTSFNTITILNDKSCSSYRGKTWTEGPNPRVSKILVVNNLLFLVTVAKHLVEDFTSWRALTIIIIFSELRDVIVDRR